MRTLTDRELIKPSFPSMQQIIEDIANPALLQEGKSKEQPPIATTIENNSFYNKIKQLENDVEKQKELSSNLLSLKEKITQNADVLKAQQKIPCRQPQNQS